MLSQEVISNIMIALIWACGAGVLALIGLLYQNHKKQLEDKVDREEHKSLVSAVEKLDECFDRRFEKLDLTLKERDQSERAMTITLVEIRQQLGRLVSHIDSETRNRTASDTRLEQMWIGELRSLRHSIQGYGRRKSDPSETLP